MLIISIVSLLLCFSFGYLALANALVAYRLSQQNSFRARLYRSFPSLPITFL